MEGAFSDSPHDVYMTMIGDPPAARRANFDVDWCRHVHGHLLRVVSEQVPGQGVKPFARSDSNSSVAFQGLRP